MVDPKSDANNGSTGIRNRVRKFDREYDEGSPAVSYAVGAWIDNETSVLQLRSATFAPCTLSKCKYTRIYVKMDSNNFGAGYHLPIAARSKVVFVSYSWRTMHGSR